MSGRERDLPREPERKFKGVWICASLWDRPDLTYVEKFLIAEIDSLCDNGDGCYAGNDHLAMRLHAAPAYTRNMLADLTSRGFLIRLGFNGREIRRCTHPDIASDSLATKNLIAKYGAVFSPHLFVRADLTPDLNLKSQICDTEIPSRDTKGEKTKTSKSTPLSAAKRKVRRGSRESSSSISLSGEAKEKSANRRNGMRSMLSPVDSDDLANRLASKGKLNDSQRDKIAAHIAHSEEGRGYVLQCEAIADSEPRKNWARAFMAAFRDRWQPAVSTIQSKTAKSRQSHQPRQAEPDPRENLSDEQLVAKTEPLRRLRESSGRA